MCHTGGWYFLTHVYCMQKTEYLFFKKNMSDARDHLLTRKPPRLGIQIIDEFQTNSRFFLLNVCYLIYLKIYGPHYSFIQTLGIKYSLSEKFSNNASLL